MATYPSRPPACMILKSGINHPIGHVYSMVDLKTGIPARAMVVGHATAEEYLVQPMDSFPQLPDGPLHLDPAYPYYLVVSVD